MKTDDFIGLLAADSAPPWRLRAVLAAAIAGGAAIAATLLFATLGLRPDINDALGSGRFLFKFVVTLALAVTAAMAVMRLGRPDATLGSKALILAIAPALLGVAVIIELTVLPETQWLPKLVGRNAIDCLLLIPLLAIGPLACLLLALRQGAPSNPGLAGAVAGLAASGIAATFYAANCADDSPLFVTTWYSIATLLVAAGGYLIGRRWLRW
uniref:DUF1109 family protein n=1 Tax=Rhodopseudomonas palustris (strain BisA53) TaxID=316055 RepID=Q07Q95_RHOP5